VCCCFDSFADSGAPFFVTNSLVQNLPDETTLPMGNRPEGLLAPETRYCAAMDNLGRCFLGLDRGVGSLTPG